MYCTNSLFYFSVCLYGAETYLARLRFSTHRNITISFLHRNILEAAIYYQKHINIYNSQVTRL